MAAAMIAVQTIAGCTFQLAAAIAIKPQIPASANSRIFRDQIRPKLIAAAAIIIIRVQLISEIPKPSHLVFVNQAAILAISATVIHPE